MAISPSTSSHCLVQSTKHTSLYLHGRSRRKPRGGDVFCSSCNPISSTRSLAALRSDLRFPFPIPARRRRSSNLVLFAAALDGEEQVRDGHRPEGSRLRQHPTSSTLGIISPKLLDFVEEVHGYATGRLSIPDEDDLDVWFLIPEAPAFPDFDIGIFSGVIRFIREVVSDVLIGSSSIFLFREIPGFAIILFGLIPGLLLVKLSELSCYWRKRGQPSGLFIYGQAVIAMMLFIRECLLSSQIYAISTLLSSIVSGAIAAFYMKKIVVRSVAALYRKKTVNCSNKRGSLK